MTKRYSPATFAAAILLSATLSASASAQTADRPILGTSTNEWSMEVVADGLDYPWDLERICDAVAFTEAAGSVAMIVGGKVVRHVVQTSDPIIREGGGGLLGMALPSDFQSSQLAYFYHTYRSRNGLTNKVIEARFDGHGWNETRVLLSGIPGHWLYNGGRIAFGPDGHLYVTTGWTENPALPQNLDSLAGKVLRMKRDGSRPDDNPFPGKLIYSYGHRNPQGLAWNERGELYVAEHGQSARDEINRIVAGGNYGWPVVSGDEQGNGMIAPFVQSGSNTWAPSGVAFAGNELLVSALQSRALLVVDEKNQSLLEVFSSSERLRDVLVAPNGIYVITTNQSPRATGASADRLLRLTRRQ